MRYAITFVIHGLIFGALFWLLGWEPERGFMAVWCGVVYLWTLFMAMVFAASCDVESEEEDEGDDE
jgi:hypothetical protein